MTQEIKTIKLNIGFKLGAVNCYLVKNDPVYILIDTGPSNKCVELEKELENAGCKLGNLKLTIITHGDFDHTGNAMYLRKKFDTKIAMHYDDLGMAEHGDMFWNRKSNFIKKIAPILLDLANRKYLSQIYILRMDKVSQNTDSMLKSFIFLGTPRVPSRS